MSEITLPYKYQPRDYQIPMFEARDRGIRFFFLMWQRRAGKDKNCFNFTVREAFSRVGIYYYILPTYSQGRKAIWEQIGADGFAMLDHIPKALVDAKNSQEMMVKLKNGSIIRIIGSDNMDSIVGSNPAGIV